MSKEMDESQAILRAWDVMRIFMVARGVTAVNGVSLSIRRGEFLLISGPSGCGKTTLLSILGGLDRPNHGDVELEGERYSRLSENGLARLRRNKIGFVFQFFNLLPDLTALENVILPMRLVGRPESRCLSRARQLLETVGLPDRVEHYPYELSGGEQQRVAIARALANEPVVVLADEPTGNLDSENSRAVMDLFRHLNQAEGQTFVVISHDPSAGRYADRVAVMRDGEIVKLEAGVR